MEVLFYGFKEAGLYSYCEAILVFSNAVKELLAHKRHIAIMEYYDSD